MSGNGNYGEDDGARAEADQYFAVIPEWLIFSDVSPSAFKLYAILRRHADDGGLAYPSRARLAALMPCTVRTIDRLTEELRNLGALEVEPRWDGKRQRSNLYRVLSLPPAKLASPRGVTPDAHKEDVGVAHQGAMRVAQNQSHIEPEPLEPSIVSTREEDFALFWATYPRKTGKRAARNAFAKAIQRALSDEILAGAERYRDDPNREAQYTPHPTTWLNQDRWEDDPLPPRTNGKARSVSNILALAEGLERR